VSSKSIATGAVLAALVWALWSGLAAAQSPARSSTPTDPSPKPDVVAAARQWAGGDAQGKATLEALARAGRSDAQLTLGELLRGLEPNNPATPAAACRYFAMAANARAEAMHNAAFCAEAGVGGSPDFAKAASLYQRAADRGYAKSMCALGNLYVAGKGVPKDAKRGAELCRKGAEGGDRDAQTDLANFYLGGIGVARDPVQARAWYTKAADQGQANAQLTLGEIYWNGDGIPADRTKAVALWRQSFDNGKAEAGALLGVWAASEWLASHKPGDITLLDEAIGWDEAAARGSLGEPDRTAARSQLAAAQAMKAAAIGAPTADPSGAATVVQGDWSKQPNGAASGDFSVLQISTTDPRKLVTDWERPTAGIQLTTSTRSARNTPIVTFIIFKGCRADASGSCNVTADFETVTPGGGVINQTKAAKVWVGKPPPPDLNLQLSNSAYALTVADKDPVGVYHVRVAVTDHVSGVTLTTSQALTIADK